MRLAEPAAAAGDLDGARREIARFERARRTPAGSARILANARSRRGSRCARATWPRVAGDPRPMLRRRRAADPSADAAGQAHAAHHGGAARARARRPRRGDQRARRSPATAWRWRRGTCRSSPATAPPRGWPWRTTGAEDAAELLGAAARVRGVEDRDRPHRRRAAATRSRAALRRRLSPRVRAGTALTRVRTRRTARPRPRCGRRVPRSAVRRGAGRRAAPAGRTPRAARPSRPGSTSGCSATGPPIISPRTVLTRWVIGLTSDEGLQPAGQRRRSARRCCWRTPAAARAGT